ncbi:MAG: hypothetical protein ACXQTY_07800 [Candidatus Methanogasteraceae archaeon]
MNARYLIPALLLVGMALSGCVDNQPGESTPDDADIGVAPETTQEAEPGDVGGSGAASNELSKLELDDIESDLAELEALLGELDNESDLAADLDESMYT